MKVDLFWKTVDSRIKTLLLHPAQRVQPATLFRLHPCWAVALPLSADSNSGCSHTLNSGREEIRGVVGPPYTHPAGVDGWPRARRYRHRRRHPCLHRAPCPAAHTPIVDPIAALYITASISIKVAERPKTRRISTIIQSVLVGLWHQRSEITAAPSKTSPPSLPTNIAISHRELGRRLQPDTIAEAHRFSNSTFTGAADQCTGNLEALAQHIWPLPGWAWRGASPTALTAGA